MTTVQAKSGLGSFVQGTEEMSQHSLLQRFSLYYFLVGLTIVSIGYDDIVLSKLSVQTSIQVVNKRFTMVNKWFS